MKYVEREMYIRNPYENLAVYNVVKLTVIQNMLTGTIVYPILRKLYIWSMHGESFLIVCALRITALRKVKVC